MTDNRELNFVKVEAKGFQDLCNRIAELEQENQSLRLENDFLQKELHDIKSMSMFEFGNRYCSSESLEADGHAFARSLLGKPMTPSDIAEEEFIASGEAHYARFSGVDD